MKTASLLLAPIVAVLAKPVPRYTVARDAVAFTNQLWTRAEVGTYNASLPNVTVFATGGTIAGSASSSSDTTGYTAGVVGVEALFAAVPAVYNVSNPTGIQISNVGSEEITQQILLNLTRQIQAELESPYCQGVVVTHGTDTLEETAMFLDLTIRSEKPVVIVGAMRPATAISADGPENLLAAVTLAVSDKGKGRGTMIVLNDRIANGYYTTKTNANTLDTFKSYEQGFLGYFVDIKPVFYYPPALPLGKPYFEIASDVTSLPDVEVIYGHEDLNPKIAAAAVQLGAKGLVLAGMGAGGWTNAGQAVIDELTANNGTAVVFSRRTMDGFVEAHSTPGQYGGGWLNPQKARVVLQLGLSAGYPDAALRTLFESINP
ncbi:l-asparaginase [Ophiostoma piceae UAMH 11346]|uniref:asparaginase n=1 Tax=Ophiostoma piceae (strain UAMH 11346) TaxID=1262450 RepID=S3CB59_OPHP1|nr:l-asparaginase [Ophiostoma piceae UAMH 11346]